MTHSQDKEGEEDLEFILQSYREKIMKGDTQDETDINGATDAEDGVRFGSSGRNAAAAVHCKYWFRVRRGRRYALSLVVNSRRYALSLIVNI